MSKTPGRKSAAPHKAEGVLVCSLSSFTAEKLVDLGKRKDRLCHNNERQGMTQRHSRTTDGAQQVKGLVTKSGDLS